MIAQDEYDGMTSVMLWRFDATSFCLEVFTSWLKPVSNVTLLPGEGALTLCRGTSSMTGNCTGQIGSLMHTWLRNVDPILFDLFELRNVFD